MDTKELGQDLVALGQRLSGLQDDAIQTFSRRVQDRPAGAVILALGIGTVFGFLLALASAKMPLPGTNSLDAPSRKHTRRPRDEDA
jgi:hypothetical protein